MGGRVLEHEGKTIYNTGFVAGKEQGFERGQREANFETERRLRDAGMNDTQIHQFTNLSLDDLRML